jgi:hypothetical protein
MNRIDSFWNNYFIHWNISSEMEKDKYLLVDNSGPLRMKPKRAEKRKADDDEAQPAKQQRMELVGVDDAANGVISIDN